MSLSDTITDIIDDGKGRITGIFGRGKARDFKRVDGCPYQFDCADRNYGGDCQGNHYDCDRFLDREYGDTNDIYLTLGIKRMRE